MADDLDGPIFGAQIERIEAEPPRVAPGGDVVLVFPFHESEFISHRPCRLGDINTSSDRALAQRWILDRILFSCSKLMQARRSRDHCMGPSDDADDTEHDDDDVHGFDVSFFVDVQTQPASDTFLGAVNSTRTFITRLGCEMPPDFKSWFFSFIEAAPHWSDEIQRLCPGLCAAFERHVSESDADTAIRTIAKAGAAVLVMATGQPLPKGWVWNGPAPNVAVVNSEIARWSRAVTESIGIVLDPDAVWMAHGRAVKIRKKFPKPSWWCDEFGGYYDKLLSLDMSQQPAGYTVYARFKTNHSLKYCMSRLLAPWGKKKQPPLIEVSKFISMIQIVKPNTSDDETKLVTWILKDAFGARRAAVVGRQVPATGLEPEIFWKLPLDRDADYKKIAMMYKSGIFTCTLLPGMVKNDFNRGMVESLRSAEHLLSTGTVEQRAVAYFLHQNASIATLYSNAFAGDVDGSSATQALNRAFRDRTVIERGMAWFQGRTLDPAKMIQQILLFMREKYAMIDGHDVFVVLLMCAMDATRHTFNFHLNGLVDGEKGQGKSAWIAYLKRLLIPGTMEHLSWETDQSDNTETCTNNLIRDLGEVPATMFMTGIDARGVNASALQLHAKNTRTKDMLVECRAEFNYYHYDKETGTRLMKKGISEHIRSNIATLNVTLPKSQRDDATDDRFIIRTMKSSQEIKEKRIQAAMQSDEATIELDPDFQGAIQLWQLANAVVHKAIAYKTVRDHETAVSTVLYDRLVRLHQRNTLQRPKDCPSVRTARRSEFVARILCTLRVLLEFCALKNYQADTFQWEDFIGFADGELVLRSREMIQAMTIVEQRSGLLDETLVKRGLRAVHRARHWSMVHVQNPDRRADNNNGPATVPGDRFCLFNMDLATLSRLVHSEMQRVCARRERIPQAADVSNFLVDATSKMIQCYPFIVPAQQEPHCAYQLQERRGPFPPPRRQFEVMARMTMRDRVEIAVGWLYDDDLLVTATETGALELFTDLLCPGEDELVFFEPVSASTPHLMKTYKPRELTQHNRVPPVLVSRGVNPNERFAILQDMTADQFADLVRRSPFFGVDLYSLFQPLEPHKVELYRRYALSLELDDDPTDNPEFDEVPRITPDVLSVKDSPAKRRRV